MKSQAAEEKITIPVGVGETSMASSVPSTCSFRILEAKA